jgi:hypothetical protein
LFTQNNHGQVEKKYHLAIRPGNDTAQLIGTLSINNTQQHATTDNNYLYFCKSQNYQRVSAVTLPGLKPTLSNSRPLWRAIAICLGRFHFMVATFASRNKLDFEHMPQNPQTGNRTRECDPNHRQLFEHN